MLEPKNSPFFVGSLLYHTIFFVNRHGCIVDPDQQQKGVLPGIYHTTAITLKKHCLIAAKKAKLYEADTLNQHLSFIQWVIHTQALKSTSQPARLMICVNLALDSVFRVFNLKKFIFWQYVAYFGLPCAHISKK